MSENNKKYYLIYQITNNINNKIYIGKHETYNVDDYFGSGKYLKRAQNKHGLENFTKIILFYCQNQTEMNLLEHYVVTPEFCKRKDVYNIMEGGHGGWMYTNAKINTFKRRSEIQKKRFSDIEQRRKTGLATKIGMRNMSEEAKQKMKKASIKSLQNFYIEHPGYCAFKGKHHTEETKEKIRKYYKEHPPLGENNNFYGKMWVANEQIRISFPTTDEFLYDYISTGYVKMRVEDWDYHFKTKKLKEYHISLAHLSKEEQKLFDENKMDELIKIRLKKRSDKEIKRQQKIKEIQEIADYYMIYGFIKTKEKYKGKLSFSSLECLLGTFSHYKKHYGIHFEAKNNIKGRINGSQFKS